MILKQSNVSKVELIDGFVYKTQPKFLTDNEIWCLKRLFPSGYVPHAKQVRIDTIRLEYIKPSPISDLDEVAWHFDNILVALDESGISHGDATDANILIRDNHPYLIDFSESRLECDPRPSKRPEGDEYWLNKTLEGLEVMLHNTRFPEIWAVLTKHIDFKGKTLLDVGFGYGDLLKAAHRAGATVYGIDKDISLVHKLEEHNKDFQLIYWDIDYLDVCSSLPKHVDILTCFSVLPYLKNPNRALRYFKQLADIVIIECQYRGDGPGFSSIKDDKDMDNWLNTSWDNVEKIGQSEVIGRGFRSIWMCW